jgi:hypothetical protein
MSTSEIINTANSASLARVNESIAKAQATLYHETVNVPYQTRHNLVEGFRILDHALSYVVDDDAAFSVIFDAHKAVLKELYNAVKDSKALFTTALEQLLQNETPSLRQLTREVSVMEHRTE